MESGIDLVLPYTVRTGHNVKIVEIKARSRRYDVIPLRHQHQVSIVDGKGFIEAVASVDALKGETTGGLQAVVIGLLQVGLVRWALGVVFVRWERGPVASRGDNLDDD